MPSHFASEAARNMVAYFYPFGVLRRPNIANAILAAVVESGRL